MSTWYTVKARFTKKFTDGTLKRVTEPYVVNAMSFTEAEASIYKQVGEFIRGEFQVVGMAITDYCDIFDYKEGWESWYKCKISYTSEDDGKAKIITNSFLVTAGSTEQANERMNESMKEFMTTYEIVSVEKTKIVEVLPSLAEIEEIEKTEEED